MSKMDNLRAMREAKYAARNATAPRPARAAAAPVAPVAPVARPRTSTATGPVVETPEATTHEDDLCGHRAISGRTCTREKGHAAKSHRYS